MRGGIYGWEKSAGGEEPFNDRVIELIDRSLEYGPELLNAIQPVNFDESARIIGHQRNPLDTGHREIDITIKDTTKVVGFESKKDAGVDTDQLEDEYRQLKKVYSTSHEVHLVFVTEHANRPQKLDSCACPVTWMSWYDVAQRLHKFDPPSRSAHKEIQAAFKKVFELENMNSEFTGFDDAHPRQLDYFIRDIWFTAPRSNTIEEVEFVDRRPSKFEESLKKSHRPIGTKFYELALKRSDWEFIDDGYPRSYPCVIIDRGNLTSPVKVFAGVSTNHHRINNLERAFRDNKETLRKLVENEELGVIFCENTLTHTNKDYDPNIHSPAEIVGWDSKDWEEKFRLVFDRDKKDYNRIIFYREVTSSAQNMVGDTISAVSDVSDLFLEEMPDTFRQNDE